jgi:purine-binding chemotaxis protein CheW
MTETVVANDLSGQYVSFVLNREEYGVLILAVHEIIRFQDLTRIPQSPKFVDGVLNLRGKVIPVINLRKKFDMDEKEPDGSTRIIVVDLEGRTVGMIVDEVREVQMIEAKQISEAPPMGSSLNEEYILGMAKVDDRLKILLDINRVLTEKEIEAIDQSQK